MVNWKKPDGLPEVKYGMPEIKYCIPEITCGIINPFKIWPEAAKATQITYFGRSIFWKKNHKF